MSDKNENPNIGEELDNDKEFYAAICQTGIEEALETELANSGATILERLHNTIKFNCDQSTLYSLNMSLRSATMILRAIKEFSVGDYDNLYFRAKKINWHRLFTVDKTFRVDVKGGSNFLRNSQFVTHRIKDAIVDTFMNVNDGARPTVVKDNPDIRIVAYLNGRRVTIYIDSSGEPLFKRGYRLEKGEAPIKEDLAAGLLILSGYDGSRPLLDPMCGSGTFLIEAAMISGNIPPNLNRTFSFQKWIGYDNDLYLRAKENLKKKIKTIDLPINGYDADLTNVNIAKSNIARAGLDGCIMVERGNFTTEIRVFEGYHIITNPPYGERMKLDDPTVFHKSLGDFFKKQAKNSDAFVFSGDLQAAKQIGLRTNFKKTVYNGPIEGRLLKFSLW